jgi:glucokinase
VRLAIGIDVGGTAIKASLVDESGSEDGLLQLPTPASAAEIAESCGRLAAELASEAVVAVGVGTAGYADAAAGVHVWGPHVDGPAPIVDRIKVITGLPAIIDSDTNAAAHAELRHGAARGFDDALLVVLGTGIGGGIVVNGSVYRGRGFAGEIGHLVLDPSGPPCACGRHGCWETYVSGPVLDAAASRISVSHPAGGVALAAGEDPATGVHLMRAAEAGDHSALEAWEQAGTWLGRGIAQLATLLDPEVVVVGGAPSRAGDLLLDPARVAVAQFRHGPDRGDPPILPAQFGRDSAVVGAALLALESLDD